MSNAVAQIAGVNGAQLFRISLCHQPAFFKPAQQRRFDGSKDFFAVVGDFNAHHKIPLDFFTGIAYTDSEETHVSVLSR